MRIATFGARFIGGQIDRIEDGLRELGNSIDFDSPELIYSNDPGYFDAASELKRKNKEAKLILNVLDLPPHYIDGYRYDISRYPFIDNPKRDFSPVALKIKLQAADFITCICEEVKWQLTNWCQLDSHVIYNPIKDISCLGLSDSQKIKNKKGNLYKYLYVGRANDINKRFDIIYKTMMLQNEQSDSLAVIGSENPGWGDYYGPQNDEILNLFYNSVEYFIFPSAFKSIGLPALESIVAKTKTLVCDDDPTTAEFWRPIGISSNPKEIVDSIRSTEYNQKNQDFVNLKSEEYKLRFSGRQIAENILRLL